MPSVIAKIAEFWVRVHSENTEVINWMKTRFEVTSVSPCDEGQKCVATIHLVPGYGSGFSGFAVATSISHGKVRFDRRDYLIESDLDFQHADISYFNELALRHALISFFSSFLVHKQWGIVLHASCAIDDEQAYLFFGKSGAGKSTAARLSSPRLLLSDDAALVKITTNGIRVYDSPLRSDIMPTFTKRSYPIAGIHWLHQDVHVRCAPLPRSQALQLLMDNVFYWPHTPVDTLKMVRMQGMFTAQVPFFHLYFQKNDSFWEAIS